MKTTVLPFLFLMTSLCGYAQIREDTIPIFESAKYCCVGKKVVITEGHKYAAIAEEEYSVRPLFEYIIRKYYKNANFNTKREVKRINYCNSYYSLTLYNQHPNDTVPEYFYIFIDILTFNKCGKRFKTCLDSLHNQDITLIEGHPVDLVSSFCFWKDDRLVVLKCQLQYYSEQLLAFIRKQDWLWE